jgi:tetratricopeptide (TPR) repeat protein
VALGEASEAKGDNATAARAYGSLIDLFPSRADLRRFAGERLEHMNGAGALDLAIDTFEKARRDRPDHPASHRLAAFAHARRGEWAAAFDILRAGLAQSYPEGRFRGVDQILREDLGLIAAAWIRAVPSKEKEIRARLREAGGSAEDGPSIRFVLNWETDANDVDFHIHDALGGHAFYAQPHLPSGGDLYADVTTGYGPECFTVRLDKGARPGPYSLQAHYYSRGPMGYGMGKLEIIDHDGHGKLTFQERPFVVMTDHAYVNLGTVN